MAKSSLKIFVTIAALVALALPTSSWAATLGLSPSSVSTNVGKTFSVTVYVATPDQAANAMSGTVSFPADKLEVVGVSKGSVISLWIQEPSYSNTAGTINFEGGIYNPGYTGTFGSLVAVTFKAKAEGSGTASFSSASVLANDGKATQILTGTGSLSFTIQPAESGAESEDESESEAEPTTEETSGETAAEPEDGSGETVDSSMLDDVVPAVDYNQPRARPDFRFAEVVLVALIAWMIMMSAFAAGIYYGRHSIVAPRPPRRNLRRGRDL